MPSGGWMVLHEIYGPPFNGSGPLAIGITGGHSEIALASNADNPAFEPWSTPLVKQRWIDLVLRVKMGALDGFVELSMNTGAGWQQQTFTGGGTRLARKTIDSSNNGGPSASQPKVYRALDTFDVVTAYFADHRIGSSFGDVAPGSYPGA